LSSIGFILTSLFAKLHGVREIETYFKKAALQTATSLRRLAMPKSMPCCHRRFEGGTNNG
jgi:hypothetical protein